MLPRTRTGRPRIRTTDDVVRYWAERIELRAPEAEWFDKSSMICRGDSIFHYGPHFELARIMRTGSGATRLVLLNGDSWNGSGGFGTSTAGRQSEVRSAVQRSGADGLVVPFSALEAAGIDFNSIRPIDVRPDRQTTEARESRIRPTRKLAKMKDPSGATTTEKQWDYCERPPVLREVEVPVWVGDPNRTLGFRNGHGWSDGAERGEDGVWRWTVRRHWLGDCVFRAKLTETRTRPPNVEELAVDAQDRAHRAEVKRLKDLASHRPRTWDRGDGRQDGPFDYGRMFQLTMAGEGVSQALERLYHAQVPATRVNRNGRVAYRVTRWATFISSFDYQEPRPLYFLAELPRGANAATVEEAIQSLKPPEVLAAEARGLRVLRQGDVFAIPTKLTKRQIRLMGRPSFTKRLRVLDTDHGVSEGVRCRGGATLGRGIMRHERWNPDHVALKLADGKTWHLLIRNTVPRSH